MSELTASRNPVVPELVGSAARILVVTGEPWGVYHSTLLRSHYEQPVLQVVPDNPEPGVSISLGDVRIQDGDVLLVGGASEWPGKVTAALSGVPRIGVRLAYLGAVPRTITHGPDAFWPSTAAHATELAAEFAVPVETVGSATPYPWEPPLPDYRPVPGTVLLVTSVSETTATGTGVPHANDVLRDAGRALAQSAPVTVALHPREDPALWGGFTITDLRTIPASTSAAVVCAVAGTVLEQVHQMGAPIVMVPVEGIPQHILGLGEVAYNPAEVVAAVHRALAKH